MSTKISRRRLLKMAGGTSLASAVAACAAPPAQVPQGQTSASQQPANAAEPTGAPAAAGAVTIRMAGWGGPDEEEGYKQGIATFEGQHPNIKVNYVNNPYDQHIDKLLAEAAAGTPPEMAWLPVDVYQGLVHNGVVLDIDDKIKADPNMGKPDYWIQPQHSDLAKYNGRYYGISHAFVMPVVYYNADVLAAAGVEPPSTDPDKAWDWDTFVLNANKLTIDENGKHPNEPDFDVNNVKQWGVNTYYGWIHLHPFVQSNNAQFIDPATKQIALDSPEAIDAIQRIADLTTKHRVMPPSQVMSQLGMSVDQMLENGRLAMSIDGSWALLWLHKVNAKIGMGVLPKIGRPATDVGCPMYSIMKDGKEKDAAWEWMRFITGPDFQTFFLKKGLWFPNQTSLLTDAGLKTWITPGVHPEGFELLAKRYLPEDGHVITIPPGYNKASQVLYSALDRVWIGEVTAEQALKEAVPKANQVLKEATA